MLCWEISCSITCPTLQSCRACLSNISGFKRHQYFMGSLPLNIDCTMTQIHFSLFGGWREVERSRFLKDASKEIDTDCSQTWELGLTYTRYINGLKTCIALMPAFFDAFLSFCTIQAITAGLIWFRFRQRILMLVASISL